MTYLVQNAITQSPAMMARMAQAAAEENAGEPMDPDTWAWNNRRDWAAAPGWADAWASAMVGHEDDDPAFDPGTDEAVITDAMILSQVQTMAAV